MGILDALKKRSSAVRFSYSLQLHTLSPWPANTGKAIAVAWQRGSKKKKRGVTEAHVPAQVPGQLGTTIHFNEVIQLSATLYMEGNEGPTPTGPFKKKCLILAIVESGLNGRDANALGRVVIDLGEFASLENEVKKEFPVACSRNVVAAVGDPVLTTTIRCLWKGSGGPASMASSMSSDKTGGTFTTNFSTFIRGNENDQVPIRLTGEQIEDLRGFNRLRTITESEDQLLSGSLKKSPQNSPQSLSKKSTCVEEEVGVQEGLTPEPSSVHLTENEDVEMLRNEFCFLDTNGSLDGKELDQTLGQDRTSSWLAGLSAEAFPESPTLGLVCETPSEEIIIPTPPPLVEKMELMESRSGDNSVEEFDRKTISSPAPLMESLSDFSESEILRKDTLNTKVELKPDDVKFPHEIFHGNEQQEEASVEDDGEQEIEEEEETQTNFLERRWKRALPRIESYKPKSSSPPLASNKDSYQSRNPRLDSSLPTQESPLSPNLPRSHSSGNPRDSTASNLNISLSNELQSVTFLEYAVYLARPGPHKYTSRNIHAPARRILRGLSLTAATIIGNESFQVLQNAIQAIKLMIESCSMDVPGMCFWWTNCLQLRLSISHLLASELNWSSDKGNGKEKLRRSPSPNLKDAQWWMHKMLQVILRLEKGIFDRLQQYLWWKIMIPLVIKTTSNTPSTTKISGQYNENGVQVWLTALSAVYDHFMMFPSRSSGDQGHLPLLRKKLMCNCCRLMDSMLFKELLSGAVEGDLVYDAWDSFQDPTVFGQSRAWPKLTPNALPFKQGPLTFGVGMHLKMSVTRWTEWIIESNLKHNLQSGDPGKSFFPLLKASADVLMMPKELLTDSTVRGELFSALSIKSMCVLLEKFQPDEFAPDPVDPEVLRSLTERLNDSSEIEGTGNQLRLHEPPFEEAYDSEEVESEVEMDIHFDSDSEAAMDNLTKTFPPSTEHSMSRFHLCQKQWKTLKR